MYKRSEPTFARTPSKNRTKTGASEEAPNRSFFIKFCTVTGGSVNSKLLIIVPSLNGSLI